MLAEEVVSLVDRIQSTQSESQTIEVKSAHDGCPERLYDTLSSFSNQDDGGVIVFGLDENDSFGVVGVYDVQDLQKHITAQCGQMTPAVRPVFSVASVGGKNVVTAEVPSIDVADRPCFYTGKGRIKGSYVRVGESDEPMTEYEVYSYEAYRRKYQDELEPVPRASLSAFDRAKLSKYLERLKESKPHVAQMDDDLILELMSIRRDGIPTLAGTMVFSPFPQAYFPQLSVVATAVPGTEAGSIGEDGERFTDNRRIDGPLDDQLDAALSFVRANIRVSTRIDPETGKRADKADYPLEAVRELVLNALIHRDYSIHTQGMPIQIQMFDDRLVITNPGGLYGRLSVDDLGKVQPDTRNPVIATTMEVLGETENRYSGIPTVRRLMAEADLPAPEFESFRGEFRATLYRSRAASVVASADRPEGLDETSCAIFSFCAEKPRSRSEIAALLNMGASYAMRRYVRPLLERGILKETLPDTPKSTHQKYYAEASNNSRRGD